MSSLRRGAVATVAALAAMSLLAGCGGDGDNGAALSVMATLRENGLWVPAIRPPTVPAGTARLRIALSAAHQPEDIDMLLKALRTAARQCAGASQALAEA